MGVYINFGYLVTGFNSMLFKKINLWRKMKNFFGVGRDDGYSYLAK